jgi:hypothetical protein
MNVRLCFQISFKKHIYFKQKFSSKLLYIKFQLLIVWIFFAKISCRLDRKFFAEGIQSRFGEYDECLEIRSPRNGENATIFKEQYCLLKLILPFPPVESYTEGEPLNHKSDLTSGFKKD